MSTEWITGNRFLSLSEQQTNATYIRNYLQPDGWTLNAIAGMLGNMETESTINPGTWENLLPYGTDADKLGCGLVGWTPSTKYTSWCAVRNYIWYDMPPALERLKWELTNGVQFYPSEKYPMTFQEFKVSELDPYYLALVFLANYEKPADPDQPQRGTQAEYWYQYLAGVPWKPVRRKKLPLYFYLRRL